MSDKWQAPPDMQETYDEVVAALRGVIHAFREAADRCAETGHGDYLLKAKGQSIIREAADNVEMLKT